MITTDAPHSTRPSCNLLQWIVGLLRYPYKIAKRRFLMPTGLFLLPTGRRVSLEGSDTVRILILQKEILIESSFGFFYFFSSFSILLTLLCTTNDCKNAVKSSEELSKMPGILLSGFNTIKSGYFGSFIKVIPQG